MDFYGDDGFNYNRFRKTQLTKESFLRYQKDEHEIQKINS